MDAKLLVLEGKHKERAIPLPETIFLIGRDRQCHLRPHCRLVSKLHCAIAAWAGKVRVRDLNSRNGSFLNGQPIHGEVEVGDGDHLQVGTLVFAFRITNAEGASLAARITDGEVQWLLDSPGDSSVLSPASHTCLLPPLSDLNGAAESKPGGTTDAAPTPPGASVRKRGNNAVSAGQHLRDYFEKRIGRSSPSPASPPPPSPPVSSESSDTSSQ